MIFAAFCPIESSLPRELGKFSRGTRFLFFSLCPRGVREVGKGWKRGEFQEDPFKTSLSFFGSEVVRREIKDRKLRGYCSILGEGDRALFRRERTWVLNRRVF